MKITYWEKTKYKKEKIMETVISFQQWKYWKRKWKWGDKDLVQLKNLCIIFYWLRSFTKYFRFYKYF